MPSSPLDQTLRRAAAGLGVDLFGVADLAPAHDFILDQGGPVLAAYPRALALGVALPHAVVDQLPDRADRAVAIGYLHHGYDLINQRLDLAASRLASLLQGRGHDALPVPASRTVDRGRLIAAFSHKLAAHLAGLGWIGKSCLLVTPGHGPRVRWTTVLTDAPLPTGAPMAAGCGTCDRCVAICPVQAFTGRPFDPLEPRDRRFDAGKCDRYFQEMQAADVQTAVCGLCLYGCPHGQAASRRIRGTRPVPA
jgi:epoxyqueuosine reductase